MKQPVNLDQPALLGHLSWFVSLRWGAGLAVIIAGLLNIAWLHWYPHGSYILAIGLTILTYNALFQILLRKASSRNWQPPALITFTWAQILPDLACLALLVVITGGIHSPTLGFFVFHMVIASLLLPRFMAFAGALVSGLLVSAGLWWGGHDEAPTVRGDTLIMLGWLVTLLVAVYLTSRTSSNLRRHRQHVTDSQRKQ